MYASAANPAVGAVCLSSMWVRVVRMRDRGEKLRREDILRAAPIDGDLSVSAASAVRPDALLAGLTAPGETHWLVPPLLSARVTRIRGPHLVIVGFEQVQVGRKLHTFKQAWWVCLPRHTDLQPRAPAVGPRWDTSHELDSGDWGGPDEPR